MEARTLGPWKEVIEAVHCRGDSRCRRRELRHFLFDDEEPSELSIEHERVHLAEAMAAVEPGFVEESRKSAAAD